MLVVIDRETAINNIAVMLYARDLLSLPPPKDPAERLEPMLSLSPVVEVIAEAIDGSTEINVCIL